MNSMINDISQDNMQISSKIRIEIDKIHRLITLTDNPLIRTIKFETFHKVQLLGMFGTEICGIFLF